MSQSSPSHGSHSLLVPAAWPTALRSISRPFTPQETKIKFPQDKENQDGLEVFILNVIYFYKLTDARFI